ATLSGLLAPGRRQWLADRLYWRIARTAQRLGFGHGEALWIQPAVRAALRRHRAHPFDAIISTGPPHFTHQVAMRFARHTGVPWCADLRDPLVSDFDRTQSDPAHHHRMK